ncbi:MAG: glycoside hydrolase family 97 protein [Bacteroidales bacterium]
MSRLFLSFYFMLLVEVVSGVGPLELKSPDGQIIFAFRINNDYPSWSVRYKGKPLIEDSRLSLEFKESGEFGRDLSVSGPELRTIDESYSLIVGKTRTARNYYNEMVIHLVEKKTPFRNVNLAIRAFNDGVAFRYEFPEQESWKSFSLMNENTTFRFSGNPTVLALLLPGFTTSHEGLYTRLPFNEIKNDTLMDLPALFELNGTFVAITEAALVDYAGMYLIREDSLLLSRLSPLPGRDGIRVNAVIPHNSPWRVMMISDRIGDLFESDILTDLNEPCRIKDTSWIKPGKATWPWWNGTVVEDSAITPGNNFETNKYYIDFCARNGIEYHSVVEYGGHEWYENNSKSGYAPGTIFNVTKPVEGLDMQKVCDYAATMGVGIRVWVHWAALYPRLDEAFAQYEKWGIRGLMVDFMDRDDQVMVNIQNEILQKAADHHLHIQFHGAYKPTGLQRTYPNEFTREGTLNYEVDKWDKTVTPAHDLDVVFTRLLAGATDYHLGGFRAVPESKFEVHYIKPLVMGTRCHMLAMYVVLESYLSMVCDYPEAYEGQPGFEFIKEIPTVWDKIKVLDARIGEYIVMARKKNSEWYVGSITDSARDLTIPFDFLPNGKYSVEVYTDVPDNPNAVKKEILDISSESNIAVHLVKGGGMVMHIRRN